MVGENKAVQEEVVGWNRSKDQVLTLVIEELGGLLYFLFIQSTIKIFFSPFFSIFFFVIFLDIYIYIYTYIYFTRENCGRCLMGARSAHSWPAPDFRYHWSSDELYNSSDSRVGTIFLGRLMIFHAIGYIKNSLIIKNKKKHLYIIHIILFRLFLLNFFFFSI